MNEQQIIAAMATADTTQRALLNRQLIQLRAARRTATQAQSEAVLGARSVEYLAPGVENMRHSAATDWLDRVALPSMTMDLTSEARAEAQRWLSTKSAMVRADPGELGIQAVGYARLWAGQFGPQMREAQRAFIGRIGSLAKIAVAPDYDDLFEEDRRAKVRADAEADATKTAGVAAPTTGMPYGPDDDFNEGEWTVGGTFDHSVAVPGQIGTVLGSRKTALGDDRKLRADIAWGQSISWVAPFSTKLNAVMIENFFNDDDYDDIKAYLIDKYGGTTASKIADRDRATNPQEGDRTSCAVCGMDIEYHGSAGWIGRGGDRNCIDSGAHPIDEETGGYGDYPDSPHVPVSDRFGARKTAVAWRVVPDVGNPGKWVVQKYTPEWGVWGDMGDAVDSQQAAYTKMDAWQADEQEFPMESEGSRKTAADSGSRRTARIGWGSYYMGQNGRNEDDSLGFNVQPTGSGDNGDYGSWYVDIYFGDEDTPRERLTGFADHDDAKDAAQAYSDNHRRTASRTAETMPGFYRTVGPENDQLDWVPDAIKSQMQTDKERLFPDGIPLHGPLTPEQQAWLDKRSSKTASGGDEDKWYVFGGPNDSPVQGPFDSSDEARAQSTFPLGGDSEYYVGTGFPDLSHLTGHESSRTAAGDATTWVSDGDDATDGQDPSWTSTAPPMETQNHEKVWTDVPVGSSLATRYADSRRLKTAGINVQAVDTCTICGGAVGFGDNGYWMHLDADGWPMSVGHEPDIASGPGGYEDPGTNRIRSKMAVHVAPSPEDAASRPWSRGEPWSLTCPICGKTETGTDYYNGWPSQDAWHNHLFCGHDPDADYHQDLAIDRYSSSRTAADSDSQKCSVCGDAIEKNDGEEGYHHDSGEKHDHEAMPGSPKESRRTASAYDVMMGQAGPDAGVVRYKPRQAQYWTTTHFSDQGDLERLLDGQARMLDMTGMYDTPEDDAKYSDVLVFQFPGAGANSDAYVWQGSLAASPTLMQFSGSRKTAARQIPISEVQPGDVLVQDLDSPATPERDTVQSVDSIGGGLFIIDFANGTSTAPMGNGLVYVAAFENPPANTSTEKVVVTDNTDGIGFGWVVDDEGDKIEQDSITDDDNRYERSKDASKTAVDKVVCPTCDGTGSGSGYSGECRSCNGSGEVTQEKRDRLLSPDSKESRRTAEWNDKFLTNADEGPREDSTTEVKPEFGPVRDNSAMFEPGEELEGNHSNTKKPESITGRRVSALDHSLFE